MIETVELTLAQVGLGTLTEPALLALFASAQAHFLTQGTGRSLREITDPAGALLYPGYYWLHLRVPEDQPIGRFQVWDRIGLGVDVRRMGRLVIDSSYVLGEATGMLDDPAGWDPARFPTMRSGSIFVVDGTDKPRVSAPKEGHVVELPLVKERPAAFDRLREVRIEGRLRPELVATIRCREPIAQRVAFGRSLSPGHNLMFIGYVELMDNAEQALLTEHAWPAFPVAALSRREVVEREVFFINHASGERRILADVRARIDWVGNRPLGEDRRFVAPAVIESAIELYEEGTGLLLAVCAARKQLVLPHDQTALLNELERLARRHRG